MQAYIHICIHIGRYVCLTIHTQAYILEYAYVCSCRNTYMPICIHICIPAYIPACYMYAGMYAYIPKYVYIWVCMHRYTCSCIHHICVYIRIYAYIGMQICIHLYVYQYISMHTHVCLWVCKPIFTPYKYDYGYAYS